LARSGFYADQQRQHNHGPRAKQNAAITEVGWINQAPHAAEQETATLAMVS
jgi:hypothetical protein